MWKYYKIRFPATNNVAIYRWDGETLYILVSHIGTFKPSLFQTLEEVLVKNRIIAEGEDVYREAIIDCI